MSEGSIHLVGSIPLEDAEQVFSIVSEKLGTSVSRIPDGETGGRLTWALWPRTVFSDESQFELVSWEGDYRNSSSKVVVPMGKWHKIREGIDPEKIELPPLGYAREAIKSYAKFRALKESDSVHSLTRFLVAIPSPFNVLNVNIAPEDRLRIEPSYVRRLEQDIVEICEAIPHDDLAIQWDVANDMQAYEGSRESYFAFHKQGIIERLVTLAEMIPDTVEMGFHLCYGDFGGKHFVEPRNMGPMVDITNNLLNGIKRTVEWVHMPVPIERDDDAYFEALSELKLRDETELFLGLVHDRDGLEGCKKRMATADKFIAEYGISTECGFGRRAPESIAPLLDLHAQLIRSHGHQRPDGSEERRS